MSHVKYALAHEGSTVEIFDPHRGLTKTAGLLPQTEAFLNTLVPERDITFALVNAMGYSEYYGANSNTDWYGYNKHLDFNGLLHAPEGFGQNVELDRVHGRAAPYGYPTYYGATVFAHHKNENAAELGFGDVIYVAAHPTMKRIELVKRVFNPEAEKRGHGAILDKIRRGERTDVSMGCRIPYDTCSVCSDWDRIREAMSRFDPKVHKHPGVPVLAEHKVRPIRGLAITRKDYCSCMLTKRGQILPDGRKVFVYNDFPRFFDISFVFIGADRTARVMWFLSDSVRQPYTPQVKVANDHRKAAAMVKRIPDGVAEAVTSCAAREPDLPTNILSALRDSGPKKALSSLGALGIVLKPHEFHYVVKPELPLIRLIEVRIQRPVTCRTRHYGVSDDYAISPSDVDFRLLAGCSPFARQRSSFAPFVTSRLVDLSKTAEASLAVEQHAGLDELAAMYNGYRLSVLERGPEVFAMGAPMCADYVGPQKVSVPALLQGASPVLHLLASHLEPHAEAEIYPSMTNIVATSESLPTLGAALRNTMAETKCAGIIGAVRVASST